MIQGYLQKQLVDPTGIKKSASISTSYVNKSVISLDGLPLGRVIKEENNKMIISTDDNNVNKLVILSAKYSQQIKKMIMCLL